MGISAGPNIIKNGLVLSLDAADFYQPVNRNLLSYTNDLTNAAWAKVRSQISANATTAPDGTNTAFAMNITDATGLVRLSQVPVNNSIIGGPYTFSVYVKQNTSTAQLLDTGLYNSSASLGSEPSYDILNNFAVIGGNGTYVSNRVVTSVGNGWYRIATTATIPNASAWYLFLDIETGTGTKVNGQGIYLWGPQFEYGTVATEYQPVTVTTRTWPNLVNSSNNGSLINNATFNSSNSGNVVFDGIDDFVSLNNEITNNSDFSVSFWIKYQDTLVASRGIISTWDTSWNGFGIASQNAGYIRSWANNGAGGGMNWDLTSTIKDRWVNLVLVYTFSNKTQKGYIDSVLKATEAFGVAITHSTLQIGRGGQIASIQLSSYPYTNCLISIIQLYNRALSQSEIEQNYNAQKSRFSI